MSSRSVAFFVLLMSQSVPAASQQAQPSAEHGRFSAWLREANTIPRNRIIAMAEKMPERDYGMRPGAQTTGRTFGQYLGHVANLNYTWCSQATGAPNPNLGRDFEALTSKAELLEVLRDAFSYCDRAYEGLTDASALEIIDATQENGRPLRAPRVAVLVLNYGHNNEVFGNLNTFLRLRGL